MNLRKLRAQLAIDEGIKYEVYNDHLGYATFGIGHLTPNMVKKLEHPSMSQESSRHLKKIVMVCCETATSFTQTFTIYQKRPNKLLPT
jgi:GH24 family phage-related lysozyme (muramidase)